MRWRKAHFAQKLVWALAIYCFVILTAYGWKPVFSNASQPVRGITDPVIALQMVRTVDEVDAVLGDAPSADREVMRIKQYVDFAFIPGYAALAILLGHFLTRSSPGGWGNILAGIVLVAAVADVRENMLILRIIDLPLSEITPALLQSLHFSSLVKWTWLAIASWLLGGISLAYGRRPPWRGVGIVSAAVGLLGGVLVVIGLFANPLLLWGGITLIAGLLLSAAMLNLSPHESAT